MDEERSLERIREKASQGASGKMSYADLEAPAAKRMKEYNIHIEGVKDLLKGINMNLINANREDNVVLEEIARIIRL